MLQKKTFPLVEKPFGNVVFSADAGYGIKMKEVIRKYAQHKEKTVCTVRYDVVRQNGMGMMTTVAHDSHDTDGEGDPASGNEVRYSTVIVGMDMAASPRTTDRAGLTLRYELFHVPVKESF